jgi:hypothetical protein
MSGASAKENWLGISGVRHRRVEKAQGCKMLGEASPGQPAADDEFAGGTPKHMRVRQNRGKQSVQAQCAHQGSWIQKRDPEAAE